MHKLPIVHREDGGITSVLVIGQAWIVVTKQQNNPKSSKKKFKTMFM